MIKKIFPLFLLFILLIVGNSIYKKNLLQKNKAVPETFISNQPSEKVKSTDKETEKFFLEVAEPKNNTTVSNSIINISGKTLPNAFVFINEQELKADADGNFTTGTTLYEGENEIIIVVSDDFGNSSEEDIVITLESTN